MKQSLSAVSGVFVLCAVTGVASAQTVGGNAAARTDLYHVQFVKAAPGQAAALGDALLAQDPKAPMPGHLVVLRHQYGDDWDYCVIEHLGTKSTIDAVGPAPGPARNLQVWHGDSYVSGPSWADFTRALGLGADSGAKPGAAIYVVGVHRGLLAQRDQLEGNLAGSPGNRALLQHREGGPWHFIAVDRYNSWQDFATAEAQADPAGWTEVRKYSGFHHDTICDRLTPKQ